MKEADLDKIFINYITTYAQVRLIGLYNFHLYRDFPMKIPQELRDRFTGGLSTIIENFEGEDKKQTLTLPQDIIDFLKASTVLIKYENRSRNNELDQILLRQEIITFFAYLEAFFQDTQRFIYNYDNTLLSSKDRHLSWEEIVENSNYEKIISTLIDKRLEKSGYIKIYDLIERWKKPPYSIIVRLKKPHLDYLKKYTLIRNMVIHNNSKITKDLISVDSTLENRFNDTYIFSFEELFKLYDFLNWTLFEIFSAIKLRFFNVDHKSLCEEYNYIENYKPEL